MIYFVCAQKEIDANSMDYIILILIHLKRYVGTGTLAVMMVIL